MKITLIDVIDEAEGTKSFIWKPEKDIKFLPGQYFYFTLPKLIFPDPRGATRQFTLSSSPSELPLIKFTTRIRKESGFKQTLAKLEIGKTIDVEGPSGSFIIDRKFNNPQILIAGGIGITPFRSFVKFNIDNKIGNHLNIIYSNSLPKEITFKEELTTWKKEGIINLEMTVTNKSKSVWTGLIGRIDTDKIVNILDKWSFKITECGFWISGPPAFVTAIESMLGKLEVNSSDINTDKFTGY